MRRNGKRRARQALVLCASWILGLSGCTITPEAAHALGQGFRDATQAGVEAYRVHQHYEQQRYETRQRYRQQAQSGQYEAYNCPSCGSGFVTTQDSVCGCTGCGARLWCPANGYAVAY